MEKISKNQISESKVSVQEKMKIDIDVDDEEDSSPLNSEGNSSNASTNAEPSSSSKEATTIKVATSEAIKETSINMTAADAQNMCFQCKFDTSVETMFVGPSRSFMLYLGEDENDKLMEITFTFKTNKDFIVFKQNFESGIENNDEYELETVNLNNITLKWKFIEKTTETCMSITFENYAKDFELKCACNKSEYFTLPIFEEHIHLKYGKLIYLGNSSNGIQITIIDKNKYDDFETHYCSAFNEQKNNARRETKPVEIVKQLRDYVKSSDQLAKLFKQINDYGYMYDDWSYENPKNNKQRLPMNENGTGPKLLLYDLRNDHMRRSRAAKQIVESLYNTKCMLLIGTSGCGKTRSILETLAGRFGLFFVANKNCNGGSKDLQELINMIKRIYTDPKNASVKLFNEFTNMIYLRIMLLCILYETFNTEENPFTPLHWALIQEMPTRIFNRDVFAWMSNQFDLSMLSENDLVSVKVFENTNMTLSDALFEYFTKPYENSPNQTRQFPVFVDEIQSMMMELQNRCVSLSNLTCLLSYRSQDLQNMTVTLRSGVTTTYHSITALNMVSLHNVSLIPIFSGTGIDLDILKDDDLLKDQPTKFFYNLLRKEPCILIVEFDDFSDQPNSKDHFKSYIRHFLPDFRGDDNKLDDLHGLLKGRCRSTARFIELCIVAAADEYNAALERLKEDVLSDVNKVLQRNEPCLNQFLGRLTYEYFSHGSILNCECNVSNDMKIISPPPPAESIVRNVIQYGVGQITKSKSQIYIGFKTKLTAQVVEPLILNALYELYEKNSLNSSP